MTEQRADSTGATDAFAAERPRLRALAYRMLGSMADADDVVQDAWLRWHRLGADGRAAVERPAAWLTTATSRLALDRLKSAQHQRETLFGESFATIATVVGRSEEACRQIASRARRRVRDERRATRPGPANSDELINAFMAACAFGDVEQLRQVLIDDVVLVSDGGREVHAARRPVVGFHRVSRLLTSITKRLAADVAIERHEVNGEPGLVFSRDGAVWLVMVFEQEADRIAAIRLVLNPEKLRHIGLAPAS